MMNWEELKEVFNSKFNEIFDGEDYHNLSLYERRKKYLIIYVELLLLILKN